MAAIRFLALLALLIAVPAQAAPPTLNVAVYDAPPYGHAAADGTIDGASVDLWRRTADALGVSYKLVAVPQMETLLAGLEHGEYDVGIGAITITPERLARVDFSYPAHRSGVAAAFRRQTGPLAAFSAYASTVAELGPLIGATLALLVAMGVGMWWVERPRAAPAHDSAVATLHDGVYWAVVTMTTVGYGDKTPKSTAGRVIAIFWMLASLALVSILSTAIVSKMTAQQMSQGRTIVEADLDGRRLAAVAHSSGAEFLTERKLKYSAFDDLPAALAAVARGDADAAVNSIGALQFAVAAGFSDRIERPDGVLSPAFMAFALPRGSALKGRLDQALVEITAGADWRRVEASYFER